MEKRIWYIMDKDLKWKHFVFVVFGGCFRDFDAQYYWFERIMYVFRKMKHDKVHIWGVYTSSLLSTGKNES